MISQVLSFNILRVSTVPNWKRGFLDWRVPRQMAFDSCGLTFAVSRFVVLGGRLSLVMYSLISSCLQTDPVNNRVSFTHESVIYRQFTLFLIPLPPTYRRQVPNMVIYHFKQKKDVYIRISLFYDPIKIPM